MDSTTALMMLQSRALNMARIDSVNASNQALAEWVLYRHDLVLLGMTAIPSFAVIIVSLVWFSKR
jgi:hypothetical protein